VHGQNEIFLVFIVRIEASLNARTRLRCICQPVFCNQFSSGMIQIDDKLSKEQQKEKHEYHKHDKEMDRNRHHMQ